MSGRFIYFILFLITMFTVIVTVQWYLGKRVIKFIYNSKKIRKEIKKNLKIFVICLLIYLNIPLLYTFAVNIPSKPFSSFTMAVVVYPYVIWGSSYVFIFVILKFFDLLKFLGTKIKRNSSKKSEVENTFSSGRRQFLQIAGKSAILSPLFISSYGVLFERDNFIVKEEKINLGNIPERLKEMKIVQISDIHSGIFMGKKEISKWVNLIYSQKPDILLITGDFVATSKDSVDSCIEGLRFLRSYMPIYCCLGNHDYWGNEIELTKKLTKEGVKVFRNSSEVIDFKGYNVNLCGVEDMRMSSPDIENALKGLDTQKLTILLSHNPNFFDDAKKYDIDLTLAGHTHGGQININLPGITISPAQLITKYIRGKYRDDRKFLYVTPGVGTIGFPLRINVPPEISVIKFI
ncbi:MAG: metallophosphoesterase [Candidatus Schekmanbacteria bacterium]|nr:MAG: metallophosphoesterase [Candidatus Schekmanbacteria bacterium]